VHRTKAASLGEVASRVTEFSFIIGIFAVHVVDVSIRRVFVTEGRSDVAYAHLIQVYLGLSSSKFCQYDTRCNMSVVLSVVVIVNAVLSNVLSLVACRSDSVLGVPRDFPLTRCC
jgi:hypothetical protein